MKNIQRLIGNPETQKMTRHIIHLPHLPTINVGGEKAGTALTGNVVTGRFDKACVIAAVGLVFAAFRTGKSADNGLRASNEENKSLMLGSGI
jgi:hypothetical protein